MSGELVISMLLVFGSAKLLAELFERLGQPGIVGEILAGVLIGPSVFGWVAPNEVMSTLAGIGVMFLLFRIGQEVDAAALLRVGGTAALAAVAGVILPFLAGWGIWALWGKPHFESVFVGAALTATSVGITAQVLSEKGLLSSIAARIILGAAVIDDILALLVLGVVSSLAQGRVNHLELILTPLFAVIFVIVVVRWGSWTVGKMLSRIEGRLRIRHGPFAVTIILMFALAALSAKAGVAAITGAFLAGTAMSDALPKRVHQQVDGIAELFVPFFLAGIGLHFDVHAFTNPSTITMTVVISMAAILTKVIGCGLGSARYGFQVAKQVGLGMIPRGEFSIVIAQIGLGMKVIPSDTYAIVVFMAVLTTALAPPLIKLAFRESLEPVEV